MKVICVKSHRDPEAGIKKGMVFDVKNTMECGCGKLKYNVGVLLPRDAICGCDCGAVYNGRIWWIDSYLFAPLQYNSAMDKILSEIADNPTERIDVPEKEVV
jgi:hypothetical protein